MATSLSFFDEKQIRTFSWSPPQSFSFHVLLFSPLSTFGLGGKCGFPFFFGCNAVDFVFNSSPYFLLAFLIVADAVQVFSFFRVVIVRRDPFLSSDLLARFLSFFPPRARRHFPPTFFFFTRPLPLLYFPNLSSSELAGSLLHTNPGASCPSYQLPLLQTSCFDPFLFTELLTTDFFFPDVSSPFPPFFDPFFPSFLTSSQLLPLCEDLILNYYKSALHFPFWRPRTVLVSRLILRARGVFHFFFSGLETSSPLPFLLFFKPNFLPPPRPSVDLPQDFLPFRKASLDPPVKLRLASTLLSE